MKLAYVESTASIISVSDNQNNSDFPPCGNLETQRSPQLFVCFTEPPDDNVLNSPQSPKSPRSPKDIPWGEVIQYTPSGDKVNEFFHRGIKTIQIIGDTLYTASRKSIILWKISVFF